MKDSIISISKGLDLDGIKEIANGEGFDWDACHRIERDTAILAMTTAKIMAKDSHKTLVILPVSELDPPADCGLEVYIEVVRSLMEDLSRTRVAFMGTLPDPTPKVDAILEYKRLRDVTLGKLITAEGAILKSDSGKLGYSGGRPLFGYRLSDKKKDGDRFLVPFKPEAAVVKRVFELKDQGYSTESVADAIMADKVLSRFANRRSIWRVVSRSDLYRRGIYTNHLGTIGTFESMILAPLPLENSK